MIAMANRIEFEVSDWEVTHLEPTALEIAEFLHNHKSKVADFISFMRISGTWEIPIQGSNLDKWVKRIMPRPQKAASDTKEIVRLVKEIFEVCKTTKDWQKIRGLIAEKTFEIYFQQRHIDSSHIGYGVLVKINGEAVTYRPKRSFSNQEDDDGPRQTIDAGSWHKEFGEFVEVKFNPEAFRTKDINYLKLLQMKLDEKKISYQIFLASFDDPDLIKRKLKQIGLLDETNKFQFIGREQILAS